MTIQTQSVNSPEIAIPPGIEPVGWRYVQSVNPDGTITATNVPLTAADVLHPEEGDVVPVSDRHTDVCYYLYKVIKHHFADDPTTLVLSDTIVRWGHPKYTQHSPDLSVIHGVKTQKPNWHSFDTVEQGVRPSLLLEVVSWNNRENDVTKKLIEYHYFKIPTYVILDSDEDNWTLVGYQYAPRKYQRMPHDDRGRLWLSTIGLWIGVQGADVILYDGVSEQPCADYGSLLRQSDADRQRAEDERQRADAERQRADAEIARADRLEEELRQLRKATGLDKSG